MSSAQSATTTYVTFQITNNTQLNGSGLASDQIYLFITQEAINVAWSIDPTTGVATPLAAGTLPTTSVTLATLQEAGVQLQLDSTTTASGGRLYFGSSPDTVTLSGGAVSGPTPGLADFYYDFVEFALNGSNNVNVDLTQVDQLGFPISLQVSPGDPDYPAGSGVLPALSRQSLFADYQAMATGALLPFADCVIASQTSGDPPLSLLNPQHVCGNQLAAVSLQGTILTGGTTNNWTATFTITGPGSPAPTNGGLQVGMPVSGPFMPAGTVISGLIGFPAGNTVLLQNTSQPFGSTQNTITLYFVTPVTSSLGTFFDQAIDDFFNFCLANPGSLKVEENNNGNDNVYSASVVQTNDVTAIDGSMPTYTVLQFTGGNNETYNVYYPFFSTNSPAGKTTPYGATVPPPPQWWEPTMKIYEPPSMMVFAADGAFADSTQQQAAISGLNGTVLGSIENAVVTGIARGSIMGWQYRYGTIEPYANNANVATVTIQSGGNALGLGGSYLFSLRLADAPMTVPQVPVPPLGMKPMTFMVTSPVPMQPTLPDLLTFSWFYPSGGTWSAFANFLHNGAGYDVTIDGRAYALPYDDQGGFSTDLSSTWSSSGPPSTIAITLGAW